MKKATLITFVLATLFCNAQEWSDDINGLDSLWNNSGADGRVFDMLNINDSLLFIGGVFKYANSSYDRGFIVFNTDTIHGVCPFGPGIECLYPYRNEIYVGGDI